MNLENELELVTSDEYGVRFETGVPVTFRFVRSTEKAPHFGARFGQDIEPAGRYMLHNADPGRLSRGWEAGTITFERPLVIPLSGDRHNIYGPTGWKARLRDATGLAGMNLSQHLRHLGYDAVVTVDPDGYTREIVDMTKIPASNPPSRSARMEQVKAEAARWHQRQRETLFIIEQALEASPAIRGMGFGGEPRMAIMSGELSDLASGNYRLTFFGPDGPHGHVTKHSKEEIAKAALDTMKQPISPMTDAEVIAWTSTPAFELGTAIIAYMQAENTLRWYAQKAGRLDWAYEVISKAHQLWKGGQTPENVSAATDMVVTAFRELPVPNPRRGYLVPNPAWVTSTLADSYEMLERQVPSRWLPELASVTARRGKMQAKFIEFGCGAYGCVLPTLDPKTVLKVTTDDTEAEFAAKLSPDLVVPVVVDYRMVVSTKAKHQGRHISLLWREAADHVGKIIETVGGDDGVYREVIKKLVSDQHAIAQYAYKALQDPDKITAAMMAVKFWLETCERMARGPVPELRPLGRGLIEVYERQRIFFGDIHAGNLGLVHRDDGDVWVITDPGHVAVIDTDVELD